MKVAIVECIVGTGGHEVEHDRQIIEGLQALGHEVSLYIPERSSGGFDYHIPVHYLPGEGVSYAGVSGIRKVWLSIKREANRLRWYKYLYQMANEGKFDAIIFPTVTYRFFRSLNRSILRRSPVSVIFCVIGVTPGEGPPFFREVEKLIRYHTIKVAVISLQDQVLGRTMPNLHCIKPAVYATSNIAGAVTPKQAGTVTLGFFGQYRREKRIEDFLEAFTRCRFSQKVEMVVQTVAIKPDDNDALQAVRKQYHTHPGIRFFDKAVYGEEWQSIINQMDALVIPYASARFRYHGSGMLLTAIGCHKPVVIADEIWPELLQDYHIGLSFTTGDIHSLQQSLESFVNTYHEKFSFYSQELQRVNEDFSPQRFVKSLLALV